MNGNRIEGKPERGSNDTIVSDVTIESNIVSPERNKKKNRLATFQELVAKFKGRYFKVWKSGDKITYPKLGRDCEEYLMIFNFEGDLNFYIKGQEKVLRKQKDKVNDILMIVGVARTLQQKEKNYRIFVDEYCKQFGLFHESSSDESKSSKSDEEIEVVNKRRKSVRRILSKLHSDSSEDEEVESDTDEASSK